MAATTKEGLIQIVEQTWQVTGMLDSWKFEAVDIGYSVDQYYIMKIKAVDYYMCQPGVNGLQTVLAASSDAVQWGLTSNGGGYDTQPYCTSSGMLDFNCITRIDIGAPTQMVVWRDPYVVKRFTDVNPDGLTIVPTSLGVWSYCSNALAGALTITARIYYTVTPASESDYQKVLNQILIARG